MNLEEIKSSGLLELYVLGRLRQADVELVEDAISSNPSLRSELQDIEKAFEFYSAAHAVQPSPGLKDRIMDQVRGSDSGGSGRSGSSWLLMGLLMLSTFALAGVAWWQDGQMKVMENDFISLQADCDSTRNANNAQIALLNDLNDRDNQIVAVTPTASFPETDLYFHHNPVTGRNYLQVQNLPPISTNQSYQLWSLKGTQAPIPMDVFRNDEGDVIIPVDFESNTNIYAITIEQLGGAQSPNLANLIGTFAIS